MVVDDANSSDPGSGTEADPLSLIQDGIDADPLFVDPDNDGARPVTVFVPMMENSGHEQDERTSR